MFTGIVTHVSTLRQKSGTENGITLTIKTPKEWKDLELGESIATNGACLTVSEIRDEEYDVFLMPETISKTMFGKQIPEKVNLERSLSAQDRFGGHFVQGHVDEVGTVIKIDKSEGYKLYVSFSNKFAGLVVPKGSITINGVSLTIVDAGEDELSVALIPHTMGNTTLGELNTGDAVNLEFDMIGKYIVRNMNAFNLTGKEEK